MYVQLVHLFSRRGIIADLRNRLSREGVANDGGSTTSIADLAALQQHLPKLAGPGVAQVRLPRETGGHTAPLR